MNKIGLSVIGYARPEYLKQCLDSLNKNNWGGADYRLLILDFKDEETKRKNIIIATEAGVSNIVFFQENKGVGKAKNEALKRMMNAGCEHLFLMEDDILMKKHDTCKWYIDSAKEFGVEHLNFAHHGPANVGKQKIVEFNNHYAWVYPHCVGAFSYYSSKCIEVVGRIDENFYNAWEHVELTKRIIDGGMHPPFWYFADAPLSKRYLEEIPGSIDYSSIRPRNDWTKNIEEGKKYWIEKYGTWLPPFPQEWSD